MSCPPCNGNCNQGRSCPVSKPIAASLASALVALIVILAVGGYCLLTSAPVVR